MARAGVTILTVSNYPIFEEEDICLLRVLTDRGTEYWGSLEHHKDELYRPL